MNCFQNSVSLIPTTTPLNKFKPVGMLWIAFRIQYLWYQQQLWKINPIRPISCELLSEFSIFDTNNNNKHLMKSGGVVVNCFQNSVSLIPTTTIFRTALLSTSCELLSEFSIFDTNNNVSFSILFALLVVNCFQNSVSLIPTTTHLLVPLYRFCCELLSEFSIFDTNNNGLVKHTRC